MGFKGLGVGVFFPRLQSYPRGTQAGRKGMEERVGDLTSVGFRPIIRKCFSSMALGFAGLLIWVRTPSHRLRGRPTNLGAGETKPVSPGGETGVTGARPQFGSLQGVAWLLQQAQPKKDSWRASLVVQWLGGHLPMVGHRINLWYRY